MSDIWAVGCIAYEICLGKKLVDNGELLDDYILKGDNDPGTLEKVLSSIPERFGEDVRTIIRECLRWTPGRRCSAQGLRDHLFAISRHYN